MFRLSLRHLIGNETISLTSARNRLNHETVICRETGDEISERGF